MGCVRILAIVLAISFASPAFAADQPEWIEYVNREDRFSVNLPGLPKIEEITYVSEYGSNWKAHRYTSQHDGYTYRLTVADMSTSSLTRDNEKFRNVGRPGNERRGAMAYAATQFRATGKVTFDGYEELQVIPGHKLEIVLKDGRRNIVEIHVYDKRLFILECISPKGQVPGYDVQSSLALLDPQGVAQRYVDGDYSFPDHIPLANSFAPNGLGTAESAGPTTTQQNARSAIVADPAAGLPPAAARPAPAPARPAQ